jgi:hypothetical protein
MLPLAASTRDDGRWYRGAAGNSRRFSPKEGSIEPQGTPFSCFSYFIIGQTLETHAETRKKETSLPRHEKKGGVGECM